MSAARAVAGRLYQDEHGGFWVGGEDGRYWQTNALGTCAVPHYIHHFREADPQLGASGERASQTTKG